MTSPLLQDRVRGMRIARSGGAVIVTRKCVAPSPAERYQAWFSRHPDPSSIFARRLFEPKPENEDGKDESSE